MKELALIVFSAVGEFAIASIILTCGGGYWHRMWLALTGAPQIHLSRPRENPRARTTTPRSLAPRDSRSPSAEPSRPVHAPTNSLLESPNG